MKGGSEKKRSGGEAKRKTSEGGKEEWICGNGGVKGSRTGGKEGEREERGHGGRGRKTRSAESGHNVTQDKM